MSELYCIYDNNKYLAEVCNNIVEITSKYYVEGFEKYVDVIGRVHDDIFVKKVSIDDVKLLYKEYIYIKYKNEWFQLFADKILKSAVIDNEFMLWTDSEQLAYKYEFEKKEQFVFIKNITREEIQSLKIVRVPVLAFKNEEVSETVLEGKKVIDYLNTFVNEEIIE